MQPTTTSGDVAARAVAIIEDVLMDLVNASESDTAKIQAAKILLERLAPVNKEEDEQRRREEEERQAAIAASRILLAELAAAQSARVSEPLALDGHSASGTAHTAQQSPTIDRTEQGD